MLHCSLLGVCAGLLVGMTAGEPEACAMPISKTAGQAPGDAVQELRGAGGNWYGQGKTEALPDELGYRG